MLPLLFVTAIALIDTKGRVLLAQRPEGKDMAGLWEFPGGKIHNGETPEAALVREMQEELALTVHEADLTPLTFASHAYEKFHLFMPLFTCRNWQGEPVPMEGQQIAWVEGAAIGDYPLPPADDVLKEAILALLAKG
ncbi:MAG TPA: 8-oxo-dGTP diphosphatase MutT [Rhodospirillaceae bacterium]|nr:8-oxo-dGTP diphosphatase MutT [Rhodospirillaceae bacterium]